MTTALTRLFRFAGCRPRATSLAVAAVTMWVALGAQPAAAQRPGKDPVYKPRRDLDPKDPSAPISPRWSPGGLTVTKRDWDPKNPAVPPKVVDVNDSPDALIVAFNLGWKNDKAEVERETVAELGKGDAMRKGYTLRHINLKLAEQAHLFITSEPDGVVVLKYVLRGNSLKFATTTPGKAGRAFDPEFAATFDLGVPVKLAVPGATGPLVLQSATGQVANSNVEPTGPVAEFVTGLFKKDLPKLIQDKMNERTTDLTGRISGKMALINGLLEGLAKQGYTQMEVRADERRNKLIVVVTRSGAVAETGAGSITGTVRWKKSFGHPRTAAAEGYADAFNIIAEVQVAARGPLDFTGQARPVGTLERKFADAGEYYECRYTIKNLPLDVPVRVTVADDNKYKWASGTDPLSTGSRFFRPLGWSGLVTLKPPLRINATTLPAATRSNPVGRSTARQIDFEMYLQEPIR